MTMDRTSLSKNSKWKKIILWLLCIVGIFVISVCTYFIMWGLMMQPKPSNQPKYSSGEKQFFSGMEDREGWTDIGRYIYNVDKEGKSLFQDQVHLNKDYAYMITITIEEPSTFYSLPVNVEDTIAVQLYNHIVEKTTKLRKIVVAFSYEEVIDERASVGHGLAAEYDIRGKRLIKVKRVIE